MKKALVYLVAFIAISFLASGLVQLGWSLINGRGTPMNATAMMIALILADVATVALFLLLRWAEVSRNWLRTRPWTVLFWCVMAACGAIIPSTWIQEQLPTLPDWSNGGIEMVLGSRLGYFVVGLMAPFVEELVFRGAILRALLSWKRNPWIGIALSALFFSAVHMNPIQMPHAFLIGLLLGWMYYRTDSIIPGVAFHWVNNTIAYVLFQFYPDPDIELIDIFKSSQSTELMAVGFSLCILIPAIIQLNQWMKKA